MTTLPIPSMLRRFLPFGVILALSACDVSFLHDVESRREATDRGCPAPSDGANDVTVVLEANGTVTLAWTTTATNADSFLVERQSSREPTWGEIGQVVELAFNDQRVVLDEEYGYRISAVRAAGGSTCTTPPSEPVLIRTIPRAAEDLIARGTAVGEITLFWDDPNSFEDGWRVVRRDASGTTLQLGDLAQNASSVVDGSVTPGATYTYELIAFNVSGTSDAVTVDQRAVTPATLVWTDPPTLDAQCTLQAFGEATYDSGASFASAIGTIAGVETPGSASGFSGPVDPTTSGPLETAWTVDDSAGGQATLSRTLVVSQETQGRSLYRQASGAELRGEGYQPIQQGCGNCTETPPASIAMGNDFACHVTASGGVSCWGNDGWGQLGSGSTNGLLGAVRPCAPGQPGICADQPFRPVSVSAGDENACAITSDGHVWCWGNGTYLMNGTTSTATSDRPVEVCGNEACNAPLTGVTQISVGELATCAIAAGGEVWCWGDSLDAPGNYHPPQPVCVSGSGFACPRFIAQEVSVGEDTACARSGGQVWCWGQNNVGVFGVDNSASPLSESANPVPVCVSHNGTACTDTLDEVVEIEVGYAFVCARKSDQTVVCWGNNSEGQLGTASGGTASALPSPVCTAGSGGVCTTVLTGVVSLDIAWQHACAVVGAGREAYCWGDNGSYQVTNAPADFDVATPVCASGTSPGCPRLSGVTSLSTGEDLSCAALADGRSVCWGAYPGSGNLENPPVPNEPVVVCRDGGGVGCDRIPAASLVTVGYRFACALTDSGMYCWGENDVGQIAVPIPLPTRDAGEVVTGTGADTAPLTGVRMVQAGLRNACAVRVDGSVWCWGSNYSGQLALSGAGYGDMRGFARPVCLSGTGSTCASFTDAVSVSVGSHHVCAVTAAGEAWCWGGEDCGELGRNVTAVCDAPLGNEFNHFFGHDAVPLPRRVCRDESCQPLADVAEVGAGRDYTCVLLRSGEVQCFGNNAFGRLGTGTNVTSEVVPRRVCDASSGICVPITNRIALRVGKYHACAIGADGGAVCWGLDECGELGASQVTTCLSDRRRNSALPVCDGAPPCTALTDIVDIAPGYRYTCVLERSGTVSCWGENYWGQLGRNFDELDVDDAQTRDSVLACNTTCNSACTTPLTGVVALSGLNLTTCSVGADGGVRCWGYSDSRETGSADATGWVCSAMPSCASGDFTTCVQNDVGDTRSCQILSVAVP